jgi:UDP-N-acetylmuramate--alanine ligase
VAPRKPQFFFFCGIGGSGMLPLAIILKSLGHEVHGSDRSRDQGRTPEKFAWIENQGIPLFPQDGSGIVEELDALVISTAVEESIPDVAAARDKNIPIRKRADLLAEYFNASKTRIAIAGTSGKTTTTGMVGFLLKEVGLDPIVMNGGVFRNYADGNPYATALVGNGDVFVTEADESDGSIALYDPTIALVHNITLDHKPLPELKQLFGNFLAKADTAIVNLRADHIGDVLAGRDGSILSYGLEGGVDLTACDVVLKADGVEVSIHYKGDEAQLKLQLPGEHNLSNALAALSVAVTLGLSLQSAANILGRFTGIKRRMEFVGNKSGITVIDDFAHNPDKIAATLTALKNFPGRLHVFFQPHGYGFLKLTHAELAQTFTNYLQPEDKLYLTEPLYLGGTVDAAYTSADLKAEIEALGLSVHLAPNRDAAGQAILTSLKKGDRVIVMGARDDTLSDFSLSLLNAIPA